MAFLPTLLETAAPAIISGVIGGAANSAQIGAMGAMNGESEAFQTAMYGEQLQHQQQMQMQSTIFNEMVDERSEKMREINTLRDVQMAQERADNGIVKKFIQAISS